MPIVGRGGEEKPVLEQGGDFLTARVIWLSTAHVVPDDGAA
jgi:hypothetical protein